MPSIITGNSTERCIRILLDREGFQLSPLLVNGFTGCDVIAKRGGVTIHIEVIGYKSSGPARARDFFQVFFRSISRIKDGAKHCIIAMPSLAERGLKTRARQYGEAWIRIGESFPELQIWLIDVDNYSYKKSSWNEWYK